MNGHHWTFQKSREITYLTEYVSKIREKVVSNGLEKNFKETRSGLESVTIFLDIFLEK